jgi:hypothetical protein
MIPGDSGESIFQLGGDDMTKMRLRMFLCILHVICHLLRFGLGN